MKLQKAELRKIFEPYLVLSFYKFPRNIMVFENIKKDTIEIYFIFTFENSRSESKSNYNQKFFIQKIICNCGQNSKFEMKNDSKKSRG